MEILTDWLKAPRDKAGLDHLGAQAPCIRLYGQLLPGITNVTDRARYYSFYPWLIWAIDQKWRPETKDAFVPLFRKADCLLTLVAERHARVSWRQDPSEDTAPHSATMVGINTLAPALGALENGTPLRLAKYSTLEDGDDNRYFKNRFGGLGQYYRGTLLDLGLLQLNEKKSVACTRERGVPVAEAMATGVDGELFLSTLEKDAVELEDLDALEAFCPCHLTESSLEHDQLLDLFFDRGMEYGEAGRHRRATLSLFLLLARDLEDAASSAPLDRHTALGCLYTRRLPGGETWDLPASLDGMQGGWKTYVQSELLSLAVQAWFAVMLDVFSMSPDAPAHTSGALADWLLHQGPLKRALEAFGDRSFSDLVEDQRGRQLQLTDWDDEDHEYQLACSLPETWKEASDEERWVEITDKVIRTLAALTARGLDHAKIAGEFALTASDDPRHVINLHSFHQHATSTWRQLTAADLAKWLTINWGVEAHLRVALRKLRSEHLDTFRIRPTDRGLEWVHTPGPVFTNPRLTQGRQMLLDVGALERREEHIRLTDLGRQLLAENLES